MHRVGVNLGAGVDHRGGESGESSVLVADQPGGPTPRVPVAGLVPHRRCGSLRWMPGRDSVSRCQQP